jgi:hypothetical protein
MEQKTQDLEHQEEMDYESGDQKRQEEVVNAYVPDTEEERKLVRKIDLYLLPSIWIMYLLSYMDRTKSVNALIIMHKLIILTFHRQVLAMPRLQEWIETSE